MATSSSSSRSPPSREQPPLYQKLSRPAKFSERHYSRKLLALNFSHGWGCPVLFFKTPIEPPTVLRELGPFSDSDGAKISLVGIRRQRVLGSNAAVLRMKYYFRGR